MKEIVQCSIIWDTMMKETNAFGILSRQAIKTTFSVESRESICTRIEPIRFVSLCIVYFKALNLK
jgi:hypothetical protein